MSSQSRSKEYHQIKNVIFFSTLFLDVVILLFFFFSGLSLQLKTMAVSTNAHPIIYNGLYALIFCTGFYLIHFPISVYSGFKLEHAFNLSNQTFGGWLKDDLKGAILSLFIFLIFVEVIYIFLGRFPVNWWIAAGLFWLLVTFILAKITPNFIVPLFFKYKDLANEPLKKRIFDLFKDCKVSLKDVYAIDLSSKTKKANAFLCGIGKSRRVVLSDTLLSNFSDEEIEVVVAHELGHYKHRDIIKLLLANSITIFFGFFLVHLYFQYAISAYQLSGLDDISFLPMVLFAFTIFGLLTSPLLNGYSRFIEKEADRFSIEQTKTPAVFVSMIQKLGEMNLAEFQPSRFIEWFMYDHPPIAKRIAFAKEFEHE